MCCQPKNPNSISKQEWRFVWIVILIIMILTSLPYLYGYLSSPPDQQFMGLMLDIPDHTQYLSWWRGFQDSWLVSNKLTPEENAPLFFNLLWWGLAQMSKFTGWDYAPVFQLFRWFTGSVFLWAVYRLIAQFLQKVQQRKLAFLLTALSSGLGWLLIVLKYTLTQGKLLFPLDVYIAEGNSFLCILAFPHFTLALALITLIFEFVWRGWQESRIQYMLIAGGLSFLLSWTHTYDLLIIASVIGMLGLSVWIKNRRFPWSLFWGGFIIGLCSLSGGIYSVILTTADPLWEEVLAQFANANVYTPPPLRLIILFGWPLLIAIATWIGLAWRKQWQVVNLFVMGWLLVGAGLNYIPTDFQIHMLNSWQIPMMILTSKGVYEFIIPALHKRFQIPTKKLQHWVSTLLLIAVLPTNLYLWTWRFTDLAQHNYPYYLHRDDIAALDWLKTNTSPDDIVLASITVGQYVPALSYNTAFLAHWAQTIHYYDKVARVDKFYSQETTDVERLETICMFKVAYVLNGPAEQALGNYDPNETLWLIPVFSSQRTKVYQVVDEFLSCPESKTITHDQARSFKTRG